MTEKKAAKDPDNTAVPETTEPDPVRVMMNANFRPPTVDDAPTAAHVVTTPSIVAPPNAPHCGTPPLPEHVGPLLLKLAQVIADTSRDRDRLHDLCLFLHAHGVSAERLADASDPTRPPTLAQQLAHTPEWWTLEWPFSPTAQPAQ